MTNCAWEQVDTESTVYNWSIGNFERICSKPCDDGNKEGNVLFPDADKRCLLDYDFIQSPPFHVGGEESIMKTQWYVICTQVEIQLNEVWHWVNFSASVLVPEIK
jgi:hypothetical protein